MVMYLRGFIDDLISGSNEDVDNNADIAASASASDVTISPSTAAAAPSPVHPVGVMIVIFMFIFTRIVSYVVQSLSNANTNRIPMEEVRKHNTRESCWCVVEGDVYDITRFLRKHPPGAAIILKYAGTDVTSHFDYHTEATKYFWRQLKIGVVDYPD